MNNVERGKATILINGNGTDTVGSKSVRFSIVKMRMKDLQQMIF